ncbi:MAG: hypothetical protein ACFNYN_04470, partial [Peptidiphaga gingivicola]
MAVDESRCPRRFVDGFGGQKASCRANRFSSRLFPVACATPLDFVCAAGSTLRGALGGRMHLASVTLHT